MKIFENINVAERFQQYKLYSVFRYLESLLKGMESPDIDGIAIKSFADQNLVDVGDGNVVIQVNTLENPTLLGGPTAPVLLSKHDSKYFFQYSEKDGVQISPTLRFERSELAYYLQAIKTSRTEGKRVYETKGWTDGFNQTNETTIDASQSSNYQIIESSGLYYLQPAVTADPFQVTTMSTIVQYNPLDALLIMEVVGYPNSSFFVHYSIDDGGTWTQLTWTQSRVSLYESRRVNLTNWSLPVNSAVRLLMRITSPGGQSFKIYGWRVSLS